MPKYAVYAIATASKFLGEFEANTKEEAEKMAAESGEDYMNICHQCSDDIELGDVYEYQTAQTEE